MRLIIAGMVGVCLLAALAPSSSRSDASVMAAPTRPFSGSLSVLTYNVHGLPWPAARGRTTDLQRIGARLRRLRTAGRAPQVVVLQEAFTPAAQAIASAAGYRYVAAGPDADDLAPAATSAAAGALDAGRSWLAGEREGKLVGSGLRILSDYPIVRGARAAFPRDVCAGWDCLANKGMVLATVSPPGAVPIDVVTTHLNSRRSSGVRDARSLAAYRLQVGALNRFVQREHDRHHPLIVAGDFNVGKVAARRAALLAAVARWSSPAAPRDALGRMLQQGQRLSGDAAWSRRRAKDWQFYTDGTGAAMRLVGVEVPFGRDAAGAMLSDHVGWSATYSLEATGSARRRETATASASEAATG